VRAINVRAHHHKRAQIFDPLGSVRGAPVTNLDRSSVADFAARAALAAINKCLARKNKTSKRIKATKK
jgi:hypothetical protein